MPENDKVQAMSLDFSNSYQKLKVKCLELAEAAKTSNAAIISATQQFSNWNHSVEKMTDCLAQAAAYLWGESAVTKEWLSDYATMTHSIYIEAQILGNPCWFWMKFTEEYFFDDDKNKFFDLLKDMCASMDKQMPMLYALTTKSSDLASWDNLDLAFSKTNSSFEYLRNKGYLEQLDWYWDNPKIPFPRQLAYQGGFYAAKDFWFNNIQEGSKLYEIEQTQYQNSGYLETEGYSDSGRLMHSICPGLKEKVKLPCGCLNELKTETLVTHLDRAIIHLNDFTIHNGVKKEWTREEIADWLESLDVDLTLRDNSSKEKEE